MTWRISIPDYKDHPRGEKECVCIICGATFLDRFRHKTCSPECLSRSRATRMRRTNREISGALEDADPRFCAVCGRELSQKSRHKTCSRDCWQKLRSRACAEMRHSTAMKRGAMTDEAIDAEVDRARQGWGSDGSISDTEDTVYGNMVSL